MYKTELEKNMRLLTGEGSWHTYGNKKQPRALLSDGPHGLRKQDEGVKQNNISVRATCFPTACALAASWDTALADIMARAIAREAIAEDVSVVLGPGVNIKRSPLCGRNFEYYSEDPFLAGRLATAYITAMQEEGVGCSLKHFAANSQETFRMTSNSRIDERTLREIYLTAFEIAVKQAQPATIMASYNQINGVYSCENKWLLTDVLRDEWGYKGLVVSDWGACSRLEKSIPSGLDLEMPDASVNHTPRLKKALISGEVTLDDINRAASRVKHLVNTYTRPKSNVSAKEKARILAENHEIARNIASKCAVLLSNNGILPLSFKSEGEKKLLIIGAMAQNVRMQGGGSSHINTDNIPSVMSALEARGVKCLYKAGYLDNCDAPEDSLFDEAVDAAKRAFGSDIPVVFCGGLPEYAEGEGFDRTSFDMPHNQSELLKKICEVNPNTIFVAFAGSPFDLSPSDNAAATLLMYLAGEGSAEAAGDILLGITNPCGKLPETFPISIEDTPCYGNYATPSRNCDYKEGLYVGYRYYDSNHVPVKYPFGHGLSYTRFCYSNLSWQADDEAHPIRANMNDYECGTITVSVSVKNMGDFPGREIVQFYVVNPDIGQINRPARELRGFAIAELAPGEETRVNVVLNGRSFSIYDVKAKGFKVVPGEYVIQAASSIDDVRCESRFLIAEDNTGVVPYAPPIDFDSIKDNLGDIDNLKPGDFTIQNSLGQLSEYSFLGKLMLKIALRVGYSMFRNKPKDDPEVMMFTEGIKEGTIDCVFNAAQGKLPYKIAEMIVLSANGEKIKAFRKIFEPRLR